MEEEETIVEVTREMIARTVENEPNLGHLGWFYTRDYVSSRTLADTRNRNYCTMCAVGAVVANVLNERTILPLVNGAISAATKGSSPLLPVSGEYLTDSAYWSTCVHRAKDALDAGASPLLVLSYLYESRDSTGKRHRANVAKFVRAHFPARIRFSIDGAMPKRGVKLVKAT